MVDSTTVERILRDSFAGWMTEIWQGMYGCAFAVADAGDMSDETLQERVQLGDSIAGVHLFRAICAGKLVDFNWDTSAEDGADASLGLAQHLGTTLDEVNVYLRTLDPVAVAQLILRASARELEGFPSFVYDVQ